MNSSLGDVVIDGSERRVLVLSSFRVVEWVSSDEVVIAVRIDRVEIGIVSLLRPSAGFEMFGTVAV